MRDALSLLDQAIAYGAGEVRAEVVRTMLGTVETEYIYRIADALIAADGPALLAEVDAMTARSIAFAPALEELAALFHRIAIAQTVPAAAAIAEDAERVMTLAAKLPPEMVQLAYQICVQGRADLALAPDEPTGFAMTLLRLLAFEPAGGASPAANASAGPAVVYGDGRRSPGGTRQAPVCAARAPGLREYAAVLPAHAGSGGRVADGAPAGPIGHPTAIRRRGRFRGSRSIDRHGGTACGADRALKPIDSNALTLARCR